MELQPQTKETGPKAVSLWDKTQFSTLSVQKCWFVYELWKTGVKMELAASGDPIKQSNPSLILGLLTGV